MSGPQLVQWFVNPNMLLLAWVSGLVMLAVAVIVIDRCRPWR